MPRTSEATRVLAPTCFELLKLLNTEDNGLDPERRSCVEQAYEELEAVLDQLLVAESE